MEATGNWALLRRVPMGFRRTGGGKEYWRYRALRCEGKRKEEKRMKKVVKVLEKDLSALCSSVGVVAAKPEGGGGGGGMAGEIKAQVMSEAAELLLSQLKQLRADAKEMKKKRKQEKAAMKAANKKECKDDGSSSSSESSDSECETVFKMSSLRTLINNPTETEPKKVSSPLAPSVLLQTTEDAIKEAEDNNITEEEEIAAEMVVKPVDKIEVCMGGKCKKSGATVLLAELERKVGIEGAVVGCKCMGKCRSGPNVRVVNHQSSRAGDDGSHSGVLTNPLCIGVGLEDVTSIVANFWGEKKDVGLLAA